MRVAIAGCWCLLVAGVPSAHGQTVAETKPANPREQFFAEGKVVKLDLEIGKKEMDSLRGDAKKYVRAKLTEDGKTVYDGVGVHLRGSAGSFRGVDDKPGLTLNMDKFAEGQRFHGMDKFHLANSNQDPTFLQELLTGEVFRAAGVPAAYVGHAVVTLNGRKLGMYYLKEGYDKGFLTRSFGNSDGNFYDGGFLRDIDQPLGLLSSKGDVPDRADLDALYDAAKLGDQGRRFRRLEKLLDLDQFLAYVAVDVLTCNWDGYGNNRNNYRIYHDPKRNKLLFVPSGLDQMWGDPNWPVLPGFQGEVVRALLETPEGRQRYINKLTSVVKTAYKPEALVKRLDELQARIQPALLAVDEGAGKSLPGQINRLRDAIPRRAKSVDDQLQQLAREKAAREKAERERRERKEREAREKAEKERMEKEAKEKAEKEKAEKEKAEKEKAAKEKADREKAAKDKEAKDKAAKDKAPNAMPEKK